MSLGLSLDSTLDEAEEIRFKQRNKNLIMKLSKQTHLTYREIESLALIYYKIQKVGDGIHVPIQRFDMRYVLHDMLDMSNYELMPFILSYHDNSAKPYISLESWIKMMNLYLRGTLEEKIFYCYTVYKNTGIKAELIRNNMVNLLISCCRTEKNENDEDMAKDLVELLIKRMDFDRDGRLQYDNFRETVLQSPGYLESFGEILPSRLAVSAFEQTFMENVKKK